MYIYIYIYLFVCLEIPKDHGLGVPVLLYIFVALRGALCILHIPGHGVHCWVVV